MRFFRISRGVPYAGLMAVLTVFALAGCQHGPYATAATLGPVPGVAPSSITDSVAAAATALKVTVSLSPALAGRANPEDTVFIFARPAQGPRMPLAIVRKQVKDLPVTVVLDDGQAMSPHMKLSAVPELVVVARVTRSGMADVQEGDLEGVSAPVVSGTRSVSVRISSVLTGKTRSLPSGHP